MPIFIDTETTGLPKKRQGALVEPNIWPDLVSIAWIITTDDGTIVTSFYTIICPNGWIIPRDSIAIHGITNEVAKDHGFPLENVLGKLLYHELQSNSRIVAHNLDFDMNVILNALKWRLNMSTDGLFKNSFCTMKAGKKLMAGFRFPKLPALYQILFGQMPNMILHNAMNDAFLCMKIYFKINNLPPETPITIRNVGLPPIAPKKLSICLAEANN